MLRSMLPLLLLVFVFSCGNAQTYTLLSYNIRLDNPNDGPDRWELRKEALAKTVLDYHPSIVGMQEVTPPQVRYLDAQFVGYQRFGVGREDGMDKGEYSPLYIDTSVFLLLSGHTIWMSETPETPGKGWDAACERVASLVILKDKKTGDSIWVANTHWDHIGTLARLHSAELIHKNLARALERGQRVIFMGDLNATPDEAPIIYFQRFMTSACPPEKDLDGTFNGFDLRAKKFKRIDYVWLSPGNWKVLQYEVPHPKVEGRYVSDHFPVVVEVGY